MFFWEIFFSLPSYDDDNTCVIFLRFKSADSNIATMSKQQHRENVKK